MKKNKLKSICLAVVAVVNSQLSFAVVEHNEVERFIGATSIESKGKGVTIAVIEGGYDPSLLPENLRNQVVHASNLVTNSRDLALFLIPPFKEENNLMVVVGKKALSGLFNRDRNDGENVIKNTMQLSLWNNNDSLNDLEEGLKIMLEFPDVSCQRAYYDRSHQGMLITGVAYYPTPEDAQREGNLTLKEGVHCMQTKNTTLPQIAAEPSFENSNESPRMDSLQTNASNLDLSDKSSSSQMYQETIVPLYLDAANKAVEEGARHCQEVLSALFLVAPEVKVKIYSPFEIGAAAADRDVQVISMSSLAYNTGQLKDGSFVAERVLEKSLPSLKNSGKLITIGLSNDNQPVQNAPLDLDLFKLAAEAEGFSVLLASTGTTKSDTDLGNTGNYLKNTDPDWLKDHYLTAPGHDILVGGNYVAGCSYASPIVAGAAARLLSSYPNQTEKIARALVASGRKPIPGSESDQGEKYYNHLDLGRAETILKTE